MAESPDLNWLVGRTLKEIGREVLRTGKEARAAMGGGGPGGADHLSEMQRFQQSLEGLDEGDLAIYGAALSGLEDTLMGAAPLHYQSVLDHLLQNIGSLLDDLGCFDIFAADLPPVTADFKWAATLQARVDFDVSLPLEQTRRRLRQTALAPIFHGQRVALAIQRLYRPRLLRPPDPDLWVYGLVGRDTRVPSDVTLLVTRDLPDTAPVTQAELPVVSQRSRLRDILFGSLPPRQEVLLRLESGDFVHLLHGLLLDTRAYCRKRARDQQQLEQLNRVLFQVLARSGARVRPDADAAP